MSRPTSAVIPLLAVLGLLATGWFLARTPTGTDFREMFAQNIQEYDIQGRVVDLTTGQGLPGCEIRIDISGYDVLHWWQLGTLFQDSTRTAQDGEFRLRMRVVGQIWINVSHQGYASAHAVPKSLTGINLGLLPLTAKDDEVRGRLESIEFKTGREPFNFDMTRAALAADEEHWDIQLAADTSALHVTTHRGATVTFAVGDRRTTGAFDLFANGCTAPDTGYVDSLMLPATTPLGLIFVRTGDGRFGSIVLAPRDLARTFDAARLHILVVPVRFNTAGGRGLCTPFLQNAYDFGLHARN